MPALARSLTDVVVQCEAMFQVDEKDPAPLDAQLERAIRFAIATERLRVGDQLPTVRQLAVELRVNANTVAKAYAALERAGLVKTRRGVGTFVRDHHLEVTKGGDRDKRLNALADRFITEAGAQGFSIDDVIERLEGSRDKRQ